MYMCLLSSQWAVYARNMIRAVTGLRVMAELLNNGHDAVVRAGATCLRNLSTDPRNKASLGGSGCVSMRMQIFNRGGKQQLEENTCVYSVCRLGSTG